MDGWMDGWKVGEYVGYPAHTRVSGWFGACCRGVVPGVG